MQCSLKSDVGHGNDEGLGQMTPEPRVTIPFDDQQTRELTTPWLFRMVRDLSLCKNVPRDWFDFSSHLWSGLQLQRVL